MKYAMTFAVDLYDFDRECGERIVTRPGDYIRTRMWADKNLKEAGDDAVYNLRVNYATVWFALSREGRLGEYGLPEKLTVAALDDAADRISAYVEAMRADELPLGRASGR